MSDLRKYFTIHKGDAGTEAYRDSYVHEIERQLAEITRQRDQLREAVLMLRIEVNCRIEHGACSYGHLEYVQEKLDAALAATKENDEIHKYRSSQVR